MCVVGYYAEYFATTTTMQRTVNGTEIVISRNSSMQFHIKNLTFVGPIFMGIGAFMIVVACVVVFETRDKVLDILEEQKRTAAKRRPDFYDLIVAQMKKKEEDILRGAKDNPAFDTTEEDAKSNDEVKHMCTPLRIRRDERPGLTSTSGAVGMALRHIGSSIFTIDVAKDSTLPLISINSFERTITGSPTGAPLIIKPKPHTSAAQGKHADRFPSVSCLHDLTKASTPKVQINRRHSWFEESRFASKISTGTKCKIAPLDTRHVSSRADAPRVDVDSNTYQSEVDIEPAEAEASKCGPRLGRKSAAGKSAANQLRVSLCEEFPDSMPTPGDACVVPAHNENILIGSAAHVNPADSDHEDASAERHSVTVWVHQAPHETNASNLTDSPSPGHSKRENSGSDSDESERLSAETRQDEGFGASESPGASNETNAESNKALAETG